MQFSCGAIIFTFWNIWVPWSTIWEAGCQDNKITGQVSELTEAFDVSVTVHHWNNNINNQ